MRVSLARDRTRACEGTSPFASSRASGFREHTTVARFRQRHQDALAEVFAEALSPEAPSRLCATATMESKRGGIAVIREIRITVSTARVRLLILRSGPWAARSFAGPRFDRRGGADGFRGMTIVCRHTRRCAGSARVTH